MTTRPQTSGLARHLGRVGTELETLQTGRYGDPLARRSVWGPALDVPLPREGAGADAVVEEIATTLIPNGARFGEAGFSGWIVSTPGTVATVAQAAATVASSQRYTLTAFNLVEEVSLRWLAELCGLDPGRMLGVYSSGGSVANLVALGAARQWAFEQRGVDVAADGTGGRLTAVYASAETHHTVHRAAAVLGLGRSSVRAVPTDSAQRMDVDALAAMLAADQAAGVIPVAVVANAGTTNTGAIDPIRAAGEAAQAAGAWFHVDGAYGLLGSLDERVAGLYDGLELADSAIVDPHKWLNAPTGTAATFVRDRAILYRAFTQEPAAYLESVFSPADDAQSSLDSVGIPYSEFGVELSAPARGTAVWAVIRELGRSGVAARVREDRDLASRLAEVARRHPRLEVLAEPVLSICCVRYTAPGLADHDRVNEAILRRLLRDTPYLPSSTRVGGAFAIRPCYINPRTTPEHVDGLAAAIVEIGDEIIGDEITAEFA
ncbi:MAG TPA: aminotransferase class V-fold PLP-dependent enzyme [Candidatus Lustribacter sp.]|nr:aminotransferase class V-fold PLP-dependent enzyme [Candidatus Lustribacter sp.]